MPIPVNLLTTPMAVLPHTDVKRALSTALSLENPFLAPTTELQLHRGLVRASLQEFSGDLSH
jgi:hypothetical protein